MDKKYEDFELVDVRSIGLLKAISDAKAIGLCVGVRPDESDDQKRPIYKFVYKPDLIKVIEEYSKKYGVDDRHVDSPETWKDFDSNVFYNPDRSLTINTRNYKIVSQIIDAGFGCNLCGVFRELSGRKAFKFLSNDMIKDIKTKGDQESYKNYQEMSKGKEQVNDGE